MAKIEEEAEGNELTTEIKTKVEELRQVMLDQIMENRPEGEEEPPEIDKETLAIRLPDDILYKLLRLALNENSCRNRGYILDGYPRNFKDACEVFLRRKKKFDEEGNPIEEDEPELEEGE
jgi:adenylate kinase family enzyme